VAKRDKSSAALFPSDLGFHAHVFDEDDVVHLLRAAVEREGGQSAFAKRHGIDRAYVNMILNGKRSVGDSVAKALRLRKVYIPK
jgi:transcriptional regulator with XRE-family HTH domain